MRVSGHGLQADPSSIWSRNGDLESPASQSGRAHTGGAGTPPTESYPGLYADPEGRWGRSPSQPPSRPYSTEPRETGPDRPPSGGSCRDPDGGGGGGRAGGAESPRPAPDGFFTFRPPSQLPSPHDRTPLGSGPPATPQPRPSSGVPHPTAGGSRGGSLQEGGGYEDGAPGSGVRSRASTPGLGSIGAEGRRSPGETPPHSVHSPVRVPRNVEDLGEPFTYAVYHRILLCRTRTPKLLWETFFINLLSTVLRMLTRQVLDCRYFWFWFCFYLTVWGLFCILHFSGPV